MQKALKEVALFSINRGGRSHAPMLRPCSSRELEHIDNAGIYSIHLIPSAKVPFLSSTFLKLSFYTGQPISSCLLPLTPSLIYLKLKRFKGPKTHSLFSLSLSLHKPSLRSLAVQEVEVVGEGV